MSLPEHWVSKIFEKLTVTYGQSFLRQYDGVDLEGVKANWGHELAGFQQMPDAIRYALEHLPPDRAPTVLQFRDLCRRSPPPVLPSLPAPNPDPTVAAEVRRVFQGASGRADMKGWARALQQQEATGANLSQFQRAAWREALGVAP